MSQPKWKCIANLGDASPLDYGGYLVFVDETGVYPPEAVHWHEPIENEHDTSEWDFDELMAYASKHGLKFDETQCVDVLTEMVLDHMCEVDPHGADEYELSRFILDKCTYENGILSDNRFHPDHPAWFADDLDGICSCMDVSKEDLIEWFCSDDPIARASAYRCVGDYHGYANLDGYPDTETRAELKAWVSACLREAKQSSLELKR